MGKINSILTMATQYIMNLVYDSDKKALSVTMDDYPLPAGAATEAKQDTQIAQANALDRFNNQNIKTDSGDTKITYICMMDKEGVWAIKKIDATTGADFTYATEANNPTYTTYATAYADRESLTYGNYEEVF